MGTQVRPVITGSDRLRGLLGVVSSVRRLGQVVYYEVTFAALRVRRLFRAAELEVVP